MSSGTNQRIDDISMLEFLMRLIKIHLSLAKVSRVTENSFKKQRIYLSKILVLQTRPCCEWPASIHYFATRCVRADEGGRVCLVR